MSNDSPSRTGRQRLTQWQESLGDEPGRGVEPNTAELTDGAPSGGMDRRHLPAGRGTDQGPSESDVSATPG